MFKKNKRGSTLVLVIMVMAVLSILSFALLNVVYSDVKQVSFLEKDTKAFYIARAGALIVSDYILESGNIDYIKNNAPIEGTIDKGSYEVYIDGENTIVSTGKVDNITETIKLALTIKKNKNLSDIFEDDLAIAVNEDIDRTKVKVYGNIYSSGNIDSKQQNDKDYTEFDFKYSPPKIPNYKGDGYIYLKNNDEYTIYNSNSYNKIEIKKGTLRIDTTTQETIKIVVNTLSIKNGDIEIIGEGNVVFYITGSAEFENDFNIPEMVFIVDKNASMSFKNIDSGKKDGFNGFIYGPEATINIDHSNVSIIGGIITKNLVYKENNGHGNDPIIKHKDFPNDLDMELEVDGDKRFELGDWGSD
ncbi:MAG: hypothetical protein FH753_02300 [Firmicutes bacterium]|nr:hypothetical protein [Bacillota bacterium]